MYTFVESRPEEHPTKRTTFVRLDDECKITIGVEDGTARRVDTHYNFSGLVTEYEITESEQNLASVSITDPENAPERCRIAVRMYHHANATGDILPISGFLGGETQEFPIELWNITDTSLAGSLPCENTEPSLITDTMIHEQRDSQAISEGRGINHCREYSNRDDFLNHLGEICAGRKYLFRGESKHHKPDIRSTDVITSRLCREVIADFNGYGKEFFHPSIDLLKSVIATQKIELGLAKWLQSDRSYSLGSATRIGGFVRDFPKDIKEANFHQEDLQLLAEIQHYGGITFLIDFTESRNVALFFACKDDLDENGRLMLLPEEHEGEIWDRISPSKPFPRYRKQKSVLVVPERGGLFPNGSECVVFNIPKGLKRDILKYLACENITNESLDIHGGCERIPDNIREYIEEQKSRGPNSFITTIFVPTINDTIVPAS